MKKLLAVVLAVAMMFALTACGGTNVDQLSENYNAFQEKYNGLVDVVEANGWNYSDDVYYPMQEIAETMQQYKDAIENPGNYDQATVDQMSQNLVDLLDWVDDVLPMVSEPYVAE